MLRARYTVYSTVMPLQPPQTQFCDLTFPDPNILLVTLNQPRTLNCLKKAGHVELGEVFKWMDETPEITVGVITGSGRAFCAGADLDGK
jgi:enoyl-CoA hydratase/carnithine racemase